MKRLLAPALLGFVLGSALHALAQNLKSESSSASLVVAGPTTTLWGDVHFYACDPIVGGNACKSYIKTLGLRSDGLVVWK